MVTNCLLMKSITNDCDPTGMPRSRNPSVNSIGVGCDGFNLFGLVENVAMASVMSDARPGLVILRDAGVHVLDQISW
jgi:L-cysteine desulfidase